MPTYTDTIRDQYKRMNTPFYGSVGLFILSVIAEAIIAVYGEENMVIHVVLGVSMVATIVFWLIRRHIGKSIQRIRDQE